MGSPGIEQVKTGKIQGVFLRYLGSFRGVSDQSCSRDCSDGTCTSVADVSGSISGAAVSTPFTACSDPIIYSTTEMSTKLYHHGAVYIAPSTASISITRT